MSELAGRIIEELLRPERLYLVVIVLGVTGFVLISRRERFRGEGPRRSLFTDLIYAVIYVGGVYGFLLIGPLNRFVESALRGWAPFLETQFLGTWPVVLQFLVAIVVVDGAGYFAHRLSHIEPLWSFHSVHHTQKNLSPLTNYRLHLVDVAFITVARAIAAFSLGLYGMEQQALHPAVVLLPVVELFAHSGLDWTYGPLGRLVVSPRFHGIHHSSAREDFDRNFGMFFSFWDDLFGTAVRDRSARGFGVADSQMPESFLHQVYWPFTDAIRKRVRPDQIDGGETSWAESPKPQSHR